ncbi:MarR family transcriptional regulator [Pelagibacterales bacterium SAG-MED34]|nr:MarR family transcriptional regulator [Pelagibacterales bacterium SAG-MED34]
MGLRKMITNSSQINENKIHKIIVENFDEIAPIYYKLLSEWANSSYNKFQDIEKYLIILYLINKDFDYYIKNELVESYDTFFLYDKSLELDRINIIEISKNLNIPKESTRRKILRLEEFGVIKKIGKKIYIDRSAFKLVQPKNTLQNLSALLSKIAELCEKNNLINQSKQFDEISNEIKNNFTYCWYYFFEFIFIFTNRWKKQVGDLEIFSVGMVIMWHSLVTKSYQANGWNFSKWKKIKIKVPETGVNTMSISEITNIPRPTVVRKLNYLLKNKYISVNKKKLFNVNMQDKTLTDTIKLQEKNVVSLAYLVFKIFNQINIK